MNRGFSLLELVVVLALMGLMLFFTIPRFQQILAPNDARRASRWFMVHTAGVRTRALIEQVRVTLHVGISENRLWVSDETMPEEAALAAKQKAFILDESVRIQDVEYPGKKVIVSGIADISFYPDGHADPAWVHLKDQAGMPTSLFIEPFLPRVRWHDTDIGFSP